MKTNFQKRIFKKPTDWYIFTDHKTQTNIFLSLINKYRNKNKNFIQKKTVYIIYYLYIYKKVIAKNIYINNVCMCSMSIYIYNICA
jgi:hypothetical protein